MDKSTYRLKRFNTFEEYLKNKAPTGMKDKARKIIDGVKLLKSYDVKEEGTMDQVWAGPKAAKVSKEDAERLSTLGWFIDKKKDRWTIYT